MRGAEHRDRFAASRPGGFTLLEVLASLLILAIGLTVILGMFARAGTLGSSATADNVLTILAPMAASEIEKYHRDLWDKMPDQQADPTKKGGIDTTEFEVGVNLIVPRFWPRRITPKPDLTQTPYNQGGTTYCVRYTLRRLCDMEAPEASGWSAEQKANMTEQTAGMYVLVMTFYRVDPRYYRANVEDSDDKLLKKLTQAGDPVVVYLSDARSD